MQFVSEGGLRKTRVHRHAGFKCGVNLSELLIQLPHTISKHAAFLVTHASKRCVQQLMHRSDFNNAVQSLIRDLKQVNFATGVATEHMALFRVFHL